MTVSARKLFAVLFLLLAWTALSGCSSDDGSPSPNVDGDQETDAADGDIDGDIDGDSDTLDGDSEQELPADGDMDGEPETEAEIEAEPDVTPPWEMTRADVGDPLTDEEIRLFTKKITGFWKDSGYFDWAWWTGHGLDKSYNPDMLDYKLWWQDTQASKAGDTITFTHTGGADNLALRTAKVLNNAMAGYMLSGNERMKQLIVAYCKGFVALAKGMVWTENDPDQYLQARAIFNHNHSYEMEGGRKVAVDYDPVKQEVVYSWNAHTIPNPNNPEYGEIWLRTMRSKDDVPHMYRTVSLLMQLSEEAEDEEVREWTGTMLEYMQGFAKDIVDSGYYIRTRFEDGSAGVPKEDNGTIKDLASFVHYEFIDPRAECNAKLTSALIGYGEPLDNDCGSGARNDYEVIATSQHYFNFAIVRFFHMAAISMANRLEYWEISANLLQGLAERVEWWLDRPEEETSGIKEWYADAASHMIVAATVGLPLTSREARHIMTWVSDSADHYAAWPLWDPWSDALGDGAFNYKPSENGYVIPGDPESGPKRYIRNPEMTFLIEYCFSPYRNPNGARLVDCEIVADPSRWGE